MWPGERENWAEIRRRLKPARGTHKNYVARKLLADERFKSPDVVRLKSKIDDLVARVREGAKTQFSGYAHFGDVSFFDAYPIDLDRAVFLKNNFSSIVKKLNAASTTQLEKFVGNYPKDVIAKDDWHVLSNIYVAEQMKKSGAGPAPSLKNFLAAVSAAKKAGFDPKSIPGIKIAFVEATSKTLLKEGQVEFPAKIDVDLPVEVSKADLDKALTSEKAKNSDYLIVFNVALAKTKRRVSRVKKVRSRFLAGYRTEPNPDYNKVQAELRMAEHELRSATINTISSGSSNCYGAGCLAAAFGKLAASLVEISAKSKVKEALNKFSETPMTVKIPIYKKYKFDMATVKGTKSMTVHYYVIDRKNKSYFKSVFDIEEKRNFTVAYSVHDDDPNKSDHLENADTDKTVTEWEDAALSIKLSQLADHYLKNLQRVKALPSLVELRREMLYDKNEALTKYEAARFDARPLNDPRFESVVVVFPTATRTLGSGFFVKPDVVLTNWHVVEGAKFVELKMYDKQETFGKVIAGDALLDLALVKVQSRGKPVRFFTGRTLDLGASVDVIGHPKGLEFSITRGVISAVRQHRTVVLERGGGKDVLFIQTDAPVNPGNSGGPLFLGDLVIGVNTQGANKSVAEGLNFAVHYSEVMEFLRENLSGFGRRTGG